MRKIGIVRAAGCLAVLVLSLLIVACGGAGDGNDESPDEPATVAKAPSAKDKVDHDFSGSERQRIVAGARQDPTMQAFLGSRQGRLEQFVQVRSADGKDLEGAVVTLSFEPPIALDHRKLPARIYPNDLAPPGTPPIQRSYSCTATGVTEFEVYLDRDTGRVEEIVPAGPNVEISEMQLIGPPAGRYYKPIPD